MNAYDVVFSKVTKTIDADNFEKLGDFFYFYKNSENDEYNENNVKNVVFVASCDKVEYILILE